MGPIDLDPEEVAIPLTSQALRDHVCRGHQPYLSNCASCVCARGRIPARRVKLPQKEYKVIGLDFLFFGKLRVLLLVHTASRYTFAFPVQDPESVEQDVALTFGKFVREIGLQNGVVTLRCDNEAFLIKVCGILAKKPQPCERILVEQVPGYRPQAKGNVERQVAVVKQAFWSNWLEVEAKLSISSQIEKLPLGGMLWRMCLLCVSRTINLYLSSPENAATPLDLVRDEIVGRPRTLPFGCLCVCQVAGPRLMKKFRGRKLIRCVYLAPKEPRGGGVFAVPVGSNELELFPSSRPVVEHDKLCYSVDDLKRLSNCDLTIQDSDDPERPINFEPRVPEGDVGPVGDDIAVESESEDPELIPDKGSDPMDLITPEGLPQPDLDLPDLDDEGDTRMDEGVGSEAVEVDSFLVDELMAASLNQVYTGPDLRTVSREFDRSFTLLFCGARITCVVPKTAVSETSGEHLEPKLLETAMRLELEELESFRVGKVITEQEAKVFAKRNGRRVLTSRWVNTVKRSGLYRARLVVRDFASFGGSTLNEGIYSPTTTLEGLRVLLALLSQSGSLVSGDVSVAFMHADCARPEVIQMPCNVSLEKGGNVFVRLVKAVNGLRSAPLSWYKEISSFLESEGFTQIIDPTIFRKFVWRKDTRFLSVVLFYVDDILIWSQLEGEAERIFDMLAKKYKLKRTGFIEEGCEGEVTFLGRKIFRTKEMAGKNAVMFGLEPAYLWSCCEEFQISTGTLKLPTLEKITKSDKSTPLSPEAHDRYRRVLGKLAWASLTRPDLAFVTGYLGRSQAAPTEASEQAMRAVLRWVLALPPLVQRFPSERYSLKDECDPREVTSVG